MNSLKRVNIIIKDILDIILYYDCTAGVQNVKEMLIIIQYMKN